MISKTTIAAVCTFVVLTVIAARVPSETALMIIAGLAAVILFGFFGFIGWFASRHPDLAATEGITYVQSRQLTLRSKDIPDPPNVEIVPDPQNPILLNQETVK